MDDVDPGQSLDDVGEPDAVEGEEVEDLDERGGGVEPGHEAREDEVAVLVPGEPDARLGRGVHERRARHLRPHHLDPVLLEDLLGRPTDDVDRERDPVAVERAGQQRQQRQQRLGVGEDVTLVVDQPELLAVRVDDPAEMAARRAHQAPTSVGVPGQVVAEHAGGGHERVDGQHVEAELGQHVGHRERRRAVGVVDDHLELRRPDALDVDGRLERRSSSAPDALGA